jgi:hypothetical protein
VPDGAPIQGSSSLGPLSGQSAGGGGSIQAPGQFTGGLPIGGPASIFNIGGAPIAVLGGVFSGGMPIGGPVPQIFRGGSAPQPPTLFLSGLSPSGPIGAFFLGSSGAPIGVATFGGGGLPIGAPPEVAQADAILQTRTALVALGGAIGPGGGSEAGAGLAGGRPIGA